MEDKLFEKNIETTFLALDQAIALYAHDHWRESGGIEIAGRGKWNIAYSDLGGFNKRINFDAYKIGGVKLSEVAEENKTKWLNESYLRIGRLDVHRINDKSIFIRVFSTVPEARQIIQGLVNHLCEYYRVNTAQTPPSEPPTMQPPAPTNASKTTKWTADRIALETYNATVKMLRANYVLVILTILVIIVAILGLPFLQGTIQTFVHGTIPTLTPTLISPIATP
jgi:hypothetical protein